MIYCIIIPDTSKTFHGHMWFIIMYKGHSDSFETIQRIVSPLYCVLIWQLANWISEIFLHTFQEYHTATGSKEMAEHVERNINGPLLSFLWLEVYQRKTRFICPAWRNHRENASVDMDEINAKPGRQRWLVSVGGRHDEWVMHTTISWPSALMSTAVDQHLTRWLKPIASLL